MLENRRLQGVIFLTHTVQKKKSKLEQKVAQKSKLVLQKSKLVQKKSKLEQEEQDVLYEHQVAQEMMPLCLVRPDEGPYSVPSAQAGLVYFFLSFRIFCADHSLHLRTRCPTHSETNVTHI